MKEDVTSVVERLISRLQNTVCVSCPLDYACDERGVSCAAFDYVLDSTLESDTVRISLANIDDLEDWYELRAPFEDKKSI